jgi:hypothetical protein
MATTFKPMMASNKESEFTKLLLAGYGIKKDNSGHDYYDIVPRGNIPVANTGVGAASYKTTKAADNVLKKVLKTLDKAGYVIMTKAAMDGYKGRFRAVTYYLAEE